MGANNHPTVVPNENAADERDSLIRYDDSAHDAYMMDLRASAIRAGVIEPRVGRIIEQ